MRVVAGEARSVQLMTPKGDDTRPTQDRIKETLFNMIQMEVPGAVFLDLFAGSGAIGLEALSRGAKEAVMIEKDSAAFAILKENIRKTDFQESGRAIRGD